MAVFAVSPIDITNTLTKLLKEGFISQFQGQVHGGQEIKVAGTHSGSHCIWSTDAEGDDGLCLAHLLLLILPRTPGAWRSDVHAWVGLASQSDLDNRPWSRSEANLH